MRFKMLPDTPYHVQAVFVVTFSYIWLRAFIGDPDYLQPLPSDAAEAHAITHKNVWQTIYSIVAFMSAFAYLKPYIEVFQNPWI